MILPLKTFACATLFLTQVWASSSSSAGAGDLLECEVTTAAPAASDAEALSSPHAIIRRGRSFGSLGEAEEDGGFSPGLGRRSGSTVVAPEGYKIVQDQNALILSPQTVHSPKGVFEIKVPTIVSIPALDLGRGVAMTGSVLQRDTGEFYLSGEVQVKRGAVEFIRPDGRSILGEGKSVNVKGHFVGTPTKLEREPRSYADKGDDF